MTDVSQLAPTPATGSNNITYAGKPPTTTIRDLFMNGRPQQIQQPLPDSVELYNLVTNASKFVAFLKPFTVLEKKIAKARDRMRSADQALDALFSKRAQLLDKSLAE